VLSDGGCFGCYAYPQLISGKTAGPSEIMKACGANEANLIYGWIGHKSGSGFSDLAPSILHYNWF
jgi:hypothetical protein